MGAHFLTMGGGGFSMSPSGATSFDKYLLELSGKMSPLVCFAPTASADDPHYINRFLVSYGALGVRTMILTLWENARESVDRLASADIVLVGGGSTVNLMALWEAHGVSAAMRAKADQDCVLAGLSAGANCWFEGCSTDSFGGFDPWLGGLGLLPGSFCPHFDGEPERAPRFTSWISEGRLPAGWGVDDGAAISWADGAPVEFLAEREGARVYRIEASDAPGASGVLAEPESMLLI